MQTGYTKTRFHFSSLSELHVCTVIIQGYTISFKHCEHYWELVCTNLNIDSDSLFSPTALGLQWIDPLFTGVISIVNIVKYGLNVK